MPHLWLHQQNNWKPKSKKFFSLQTKRLTESFEGLTSSLEKLPGKVWNCKVAWKQQLNVWLQSTIHLYTGSQHVKHNIYTIHLPIFQALVVKHQDFQYTPQDNGSSNLPQETQKPFWLNRCSRLQMKLRGEFRSWYSWNCCSSFWV